MNEKVKSFFKKIGIAIAGAISACVAFILGTSLHRRGRTEPVRDNINDAASANRDAKNTVDDARRTVETIKQQSDDIEDSTRECLDIIDNIRKRNKK